MVSGASLFGLRVAALTAMLPRSVGTGRDSHCQEVRASFIRLDAFLVRAFGPPFGSRPTPIWMFG